jgi:hypothetical protein
MQACVLFYLTTQSTEMMLVSLLGPNKRLLRDLRKRPHVEKVTKWLRIFKKFVNGKGLLLANLQNIVSNDLFVSFYDDDLSPFIFKKYQYTVVQAGGIKHYKTSLTTVL